ncbi:hypothetical protein IFVP195_C2100638 [Vibrio parahaemolyticus]
MCMHVNAKCALYVHMESASISPGGEVHEEKVKAVI